MAKKIYLSAAAHATDNRTQCPVQCSENTHCNQYMDKLETRLRDVGFEVMRGDKSLTGSQAMSTRVTEANRWKADIYYVAHTNAGGGRYSMTLCYTDKASKAKAEMFHKYRRSMRHVVRQRGDLYEINATAMPCLYDELFFHDNAEDCAWFHNGGMDVMVEETVQALCEICGVEYKPNQQPEKPAEQVKKEPKAGDVINLIGGKLYTSSTGEKYIYRTGKFYIYDGLKINGRYRVTNRADRVGKKPVWMNVSGWVEILI